MYYIYSKKGVRKLSDYNKFDWAHRMLVQPLGYMTCSIELHSLLPFVSVSLHVTGLMYVCVSLCLCAEHLDNDVLHVPLVLTFLQLQL